MTTLPIKFPLKLDDKDLKIISLYSENPELSQEEVAKKIGISQPAVAMRVKRLKQLGALEHKVGINPLKIGLHVAKVDVSTVNVNKVLSKFANCPYFLNGFVTTGKNNLCLLFMAEDLSTLEAIVDNHLRIDEDVRDVEFNIVVSAVRGLIAPIKVYERAEERPPCGSAIICRECPSFRDGSCAGCPALGHSQSMLRSNY
ncbi:MAG: Lrp/AsnC family transcriptional regulator [Candidatus Nezhaarchaeota archaeon]|nr:Lrp/AsnC family transcriptional regulator [Candidatus Nezhaarchaeota archaeon]